MDEDRSIIDRSYTAVIFRACISIRYTHVYTYRVCYHHDLVFSFGEGTCFIFDSIRSEILICGYYPVLFCWSYLHEFVNMANL